MAARLETPIKQLLICWLHSILYLTDPESFASLILVDKAWRAASQTPHLYAHHLSRCPSFSLNHNVVDAGPFTDESLPRLKRRFAQEVKRNLFEVYLQPRRTIISLISITTSSSAAFPGGEAFEFVFSPNGHWTLALSSSRVYVMDTASLKISVQRELKVLRRPVSAAILDDGSILAVLSSNHQIHLYSLATPESKHLRSIPLENAPHSMALAPKGDVIAVACDGGVEVYSLTNSTSESEWRTIKCDRVDVLRFSSDGTMLLGTTCSSKNPNTVILTAPYYTDDNQEVTPLDQISTMWTSQIVFPNSSRDCSHAALLPQRTDGDANWMFTYDRVFESFRAVRTDDLRNGTTYFTGPRRPPREGSRVPRKKLIPCTLPTSSDRGELVAAGFLGKDVWLYGVPEGLDIASVSQADDPNSQYNSAGSSTPPRTPSGGPGNPNRSMTRGEAAELTKLPKWQVLVDKYRNVFAKGRKVAEISGVSALTWVSRKQEESDGVHSLRERLVIAAPGGIPGDPDLEQDGFAAIDGGRLIVLDFDRKPTDGKTEELTFEVGTAIPELLKEESVDMDTEVALARRRTVAKETSDRRTIVNMLGPNPELPNITLAPTVNALANQRNANANVSASSSGSNSVNAIVTTRDLTRPRADSMEDGLSLEQATEVFDGPYSHTQPRSRDSLYRSATAVAANRQRNPPRILSTGRVEYRRADGRGELPHESDADNWVPPPPPYAPKADIPLPDHLRQALLPRGTEPMPPSARPRVGRERPQRASTMYESSHSHSQQNSTRISSLPEVPPMSAPHSSRGRPFTRSASGGLNELSGSVSPLSSNSFSMGDNHSQVSIGSRRSHAISSPRRPMSEMVGRLTGSLRTQSKTPRVLASANAPPVPAIPRRHRTAPATPRPRSPPRPFSPTLSLAGGNFDRPSDIPPPPATRSRIPTMQPRPYQEPVSAIGMPSAQQLAKLSDRSRQAPPPQVSRQLRATVALPEGSIVPAPPRGALGAAGSRTSIVSPPLQSPVRSESSRNTFSRSSPALLRPVAKRLDTIESISSLVSRPGTRSRSRPQTPGNGNGIGRTASRRSVSAGPALVLDRVPVANEDRPAKKSFLGGKKSRRGTFSEGMNKRNIGSESGKGGRCIIM